MNRLAQITFDHIWLLLFSSEDQIDPDFSVSLLEELPLTLIDFSAAEKSAMAKVAQEAKSRLLAEPDEFGYTPRSLVTGEQREFLEAVIAEEIYDDEWWTS